MEHDFSGCSPEWTVKSSGNNGTSEKVVCFPGRNVPTESDVPFRQTSSLIPFPDSLCNWEGFVQMINASPERTTTIRNFTYQLPKL